MATNPAQPLLTTSVITTGPVSLSMTDPRSYDGITWFVFTFFVSLCFTTLSFSFSSLTACCFILIRSKDIGNTLKMGIPAWGNGQFSSGTAWLLMCFCWFGVSGLHRAYLGDYVMAIVYCLTGGICGIGDLIDMLSLSAKVNNMNTEIRNALQ